MYNQMIGSSAFCGANRRVVRGQPCRRARVPLWRFSPDKHVILTSLTGEVCPGETASVYRRINVLNAIPLTNTETKGRCVR